MTAPTTGAAELSADDERRLAKTLVLETTDAHWHELYPRQIARFRQAVRILWREFAALAAPPARGGETPPLGEDAKRALDDIERFAVEVWRRVGRLRSIADFPATPAAPNEGTTQPSFDVERVLAWVNDPQRKPAQLAFTAGIERQVAYLIELACPRDRSGA